MAVYALLSPSIDLREAHRETWLRTCACWQDLGGRDDGPRIKISLFDGRSIHARSTLTSRGSRMQPTAEAGAFPYATHLNILFPQLAKVDVSALVAVCKDQWYNQTLCKVNDSVIRLGVMQ